MKFVIFYIQLMFVSGVFLLEGQTVAFDISDKTGCGSLTVTFTDKSVITDPATAVFNWDLGNGETFKGSIPNQNPPPVNYSKPGTYIVKLNIGLASRTDTIIVKPLPNTFFAYYDTIIESQAFSLIFKAPIQNPAHTHYIYQWTFGSDTLFGKEITRNYSTAYTDTVSLTISDTLEEGCVGKNLRLAYAIEKLNAPNVFSPNGDGLYDVFEIKTNGTTVFDFKVYARTGVMVYHSVSPYIGWDGRLESGQFASPAVYYYVLETLQGAVQYQEKGFFTLFR